MPETIAALTRLEALHLRCPPDWRDAASEAVAAALPSLPHLTALALVGVPLSQQVLAALDSLPRLERLVYSDVASARPPPANLLPAGAWLCRLTFFGFEAAALVVNPQLLSAATQLHTLALLGPCDSAGLRPYLPPGMSPRAAVQRVLQQAAQLPHMTVLELHPSWLTGIGYIGPADGLTHQLLFDRGGLREALEAQRPQLRCRSVPAPGSDEAPSQRQLIEEVLGPEWAASFRSSPLFQSCIAGWSACAFSCCLLGVTVGCSCLEQRPRNVQQQQRPTPLSQPCPGWGSRYCQPCSSPRLDEKSPPLAGAHAARRCAGGKAPPPPAPIRPQLLAAAHCLICTAL